MKQIDEGYVIQEYSNNKSTYEIAKNLNTYPKKIERILKKNGCKLRSKSEAQKSALKYGRATHPTKGKPKTEEQKLQISKAVEKRWQQMSTEERKKFAQEAKKRWDKLGDGEKGLMRKKAAEALRKSSIEGSKAEKFLYSELTKSGYSTIIHKKHLIEGEKFEIDLFLPDLGIAIEIDGPQHFTPLFGEKHLRNYIKYDSIKNGLLISKGYCIIRVKYLCKHISHSVKRRLWDLVYPEIEKIEASFPPQDERLIELEIS